MRVLVIFTLFESSREVEKVTFLEYVGTSDKQVYETRGIALTADLQS